MNCDDKWPRKVRDLLITNFIKLSQTLLISKTLVLPHDIGKEKL